MALVYFNAVADTTATTGTGTWTLAGSPPAGSRPFSVMTDADTCYYRAENSGKTEWENGIGTKSGSSFARTVVTASSNGGAAVNFTSGPTVYMTADASFFSDPWTLYKLDRSAVAVDANGQFTTVKKYRVNGTLSSLSVLSGGSSPTYTTRTVTHYAGDGTTAISTNVLTLTYDASGNLVTES
jgi:hypothetical protein